MSGKLCEVSVWMTCVHVIQPYFAKTLSGRPGWCGLLKMPTSLAGHKSIHFIMWPDHASTVTAKKTLRFLGGEDKVGARALSVRPRKRNQNWRRGLQAIRFLQN